jgi:hypothetical protein
MSRTRINTFLKKYLLTKYVKKANYYSTFTVPGCVIEFFVNLLLFAISRLVIVNMKG